MKIFSAFIIFFSILNIQAMEKENTMDMSKEILFLQSQTSDGSIIFQPSPSGQNMDLNSSCNSYPIDFPQRPEKVQKVIATKQEKLAKLSLLLLEKTPLSKETVIQFVSTMCSYINVQTLAIEHNQNTEFHTIKSSLSDLEKCIKQKKNLTNTTKISAHLLQSKVYLPALITTIGIISILNSALILYLCAKI